MGTISDERKIIKLVLLLFLPTLSLALDLQSAIKVDKVYIETEKRVMANRSYYLKEQESARYNVNLGLEIDMPYTLYYNNRIESIVDDSQFRFIDWRFEIGAEPIKNLQLYFGHFSGHLLDSRHENSRFPEDNMIGIRWILHGDSK